MLFFESLKSFDSSRANSSSFTCIVSVDHPMYSQNKIFFSNKLTYASIIGQNVYLDLLELNEILYLESRDIYLSHIYMV